ncbi:MAG: OmpA family protein [Acidobacteria bacterium]|nr:OmpA family protein [Acidobacteriota bacterium]
MADGEFKVSRIKLVIVLLVLAASGYAVYTRYIQPRLKSKEGLSKLLKTSKFSEAETLRVAHNEWSGYNINYLIKALGYDQQNKFSLEVQVENDPEKAYAMLEGGDIDLNGTTIDMFVGQAGKRDPGVLLFKVDDSDGGDALVVNHDKIKTLNDLIGKKVSFEEGSPSQYFLLYLLHIGGISSREIEPRPMPVPEAFEKFKSRDVDAIVTWEPYATQAASLPFGYKLLTTKDAKNLIMDIMCASRKAVLEKSDLLSNYTDAWFRALRYMQANPKEAYAKMYEGHYVKDPPDVLAEIYSGIHFTNLEENKDWLGLSEGKVEQASTVVKMAERVWMSEDKLSNPVEPARLINTTYVEKAAPPKADDLFAGVTSTAEKEKIAPVAEAPKPVAPMSFQQAEQSEKIVQLRVDKIYFPSGSSRLDPNAEAILDGVGETLRNFPHLYLIIDGHTDDVGDLNGNRRLSQARADSVANFLATKFRFDRNRLVPRGFGEDRPIGDNATDEGRARNRRTEFRLARQGAA